LAESKDAKDSKDSKDSKEASRRERRERRHERDKERSHRRRRDARQHRRVLDQSQNDALLGALADAEKIAANDDVRFSLSSPRLPSPIPSHSLYYYVFIEDWCWQTIVVDCSHSEFDCNQKDEIQFRNNCCNCYKGLLVLSIYASNLHLISQFFLYTQMVVDALTKASLLQDVNMESMALYLQNPDVNAFQKVFSCSDFIVICFL
jgi:hypothetical protein